MFLYLVGVSVQQLLQKPCWPTIWPMGDASFKKKERIHPFKGNSLCVQMLHTFLTWTFHQRHISLTPIGGSLPLGHLLFEHTADLTLLSHPLPCPSSPHKHPWSCACIRTQEVNHVWVNKVSGLMAFQLSLTFFLFLPFLGLGCWRRVLREPNALGAWINCSFIMKSIGDAEGCEGILLLIASERSACISKMSAFPLSHYCPAISATSSRCCELLPCAQNL